MSILIKDVFLNNGTTDILITDNKFDKISSNIDVQNATIIDAKGKAILPSFYNLHTHSAMNLFKGISDDKSLFDWLSNDIWPREEKLTGEHIYYGTKLSILEMIRTGTTGFADMYFEQESAMKAIDEMGIRANISFVEMDILGEEQRKQKYEQTEKFLALPNPCPSRISKSIAVHAVYTASSEILKFSSKVAKENDLGLHIHACETQKEVDDCLLEHKCTPIEHLDRFGLLTPKTILAHAIYLSDKDIDIIKDNEVILCTNPISNLKLSSGIFSLQKLLDKGIHITLGTDGSASNNNQSMLEEMKVCALVAKIADMNPTDGNAEDVFKIATKNGANALGITAGEIKEGYLADCILVDLDNPLLVPNHNLISNIVYSADSSCIDTVICDGKVVMDGKRINKEKEIISKTESLAKEL